MSDRDLNVATMLDEYCPASAEASEWPRVLRDAQAAPASSGGTLSRIQRVADRLGWRGRAALLAVLTGAAIGAAVVLTAPWSSSPSILERAAAAITGPTSTQILYENILIRPTTSPKVAIRVRVWLQGSAPHRFRIVSDARPPSGRATLATDHLDVGGTLGNTDDVSYGVADKVLDPVAFQWRFLEGDLNPVAFIKTALTSGRGCPRAFCVARLDGKTTISGRAVIRILLTYRPPGQAATTVLYFVDAHTLQPVRVTLNDTGGSLPQTSVLTIRYLPATPHNLKLTNAEATHQDTNVI